MLKVITWFIANQGYFSGGGYASGYSTQGEMPITLTDRICRAPNVDENTLFRPHAWSAFGTKNIESADCRACSSYDPLYR